MSLKPQTGRVKKVETLPADGTGSPPLLAPRWPLVPVLPTPVVDGQRWCVGASYDVAVEYLGIGGVWVAQASKQYGVFQWKGVFRNAGTDWVDCGRPTWINKLLPSAQYTIRAVSLQRAVGYGSIISVADDTLSQLNLLYAPSSMVIASVGGNVNTPTVPAINQLRAITLAVGATTKIFVDGALYGSGSKGVQTYSGNLIIGARNPTTGDNLEGDIAYIEIYEGANSDGSLQGLSLIDKYDFNKWNGTGSGVSQNGFPFTVSDGSPFTAKSYAWVPA